MSDVALLAIHSPRCRVAALPVELLLQVFAETRTPRKLMALARVCHHWKGVILSTPSLWTYVKIYSLRRVDSIAPHIARSGSLPLSVSINLCSCFGGDRRNLAQLVGMMLRQYERIQSLNIFDDYECGEAEDGELLEGLVRCLCQGYAWASLRSLSLKLNEGKFFGSSEAALDIVVPQLVSLRLRSVLVRDWPRMQLGSRLRIFCIRMETGSMLALPALLSCPNVETVEVGNFTRTITAEDRMDHIVHLLPTLPHLRRLTLTCGHIDISSVFILLSRCPKLKELFICAKSFSSFAVGGWPPLAIPLTLENLTLFALHSNSTTSLSLFLRLPIDVTALRYLHLAGLLLPSPLPPFGTALQSLELRSMQCNTVDLVRALAASTGLRTIRLESVVLTPWERTMVLPTFELLRTVEASYPQWPAELAIDDVMDFIIALLPISSTLDVSIGGVLLPPHHLCRLLTGLQAREVSLSIAAPSRFGGYPPMSVTLDLKSYDRNVPESRHFIVSSAQSCFALMETHSIFTRVCIIELEVALLVQVLSALPPDLPALRRMTVRAIWIVEVAHAFETSIASFPTHYFQCPELQRIDVRIESSATVKPSDETFARFTSIFKGKEHVVVNPRPREVYYPSSDDDDDDGDREWD